MKLSYRSKEGVDYVFDTADSTDLVAMSDLLTEDGNLQGELLALRLKLNETISSGSTDEIAPLEEGILGLRTQMSEDLGVDELWLHDGLVRNAVLTDPTPDELARVLQHPFGCFIDGLRLNYSYVDRFRRSLLIPEVRRIRDLYLNVLPPEGVDRGYAKALANAANLRALRLLSIEGTSFGDSGLCPIVQSENMANLEALDLSHCEVGDSGMTALARSPFMRNLISLDVAHNDLGPEGVIEIAQSKNMANLRYLDISYADVAPAGISSIADSSHLEGLIALLLDGTDLEAEDLETLARSSYIKNLEALSLALNGLGPDVVRIIREYDNFGKLRILDLSDNLLTEEDGQILKNGLSQLGHICTEECLSCIYSAYWANYQSAQP